MAGVSGAGTMGRGISPVLGQCGARTLVFVGDKPLIMRTHLFPGGREMVRLQATQWALDRVRRLLLD